MEQYKDINGEFSIPEEETTTSAPGVVSTVSRANDLAPAAGDSNTTRPAVVQSASPEADSPSSVTNGASEQDNSSSPGAEDNNSSSGDSGPSSERDSSSAAKESNNTESSKEERMDCDTVSDAVSEKQKPVAMEVDETVLDTAHTEKSSKGLC